VVDMTYIDGDAETLMVDYTDLERSVVAAMVG
jgi:hypothetical protein